MYPLTIPLATFLTSTLAQSTLHTLATTDLGDAQTMTRLMQLRQRFAPDEAAVLLDQARLRQAARAKFPDADKLYFIDEALQQASSLAVARYRARYFAPYQRVADLGCGIGGDTIAMAVVGPHVLAFERDPVRAYFAATNIQALQLTSRAEVICDDWTTATLDVEAAFIDPARRVHERRVFHLDQMEPPIAAILALAADIPHLLVKVAPGIDYSEIPSGVEVEFISEHGTLKEALLRFGDFRRGVERTATLLPGPHQFTSIVEDRTVVVQQPGAFFYEPDPAILRASLVRPLAVELGATQIDESIAYLTSDICVTTPFARVWRVLRHGPFNLKGLNVWLRELGAGDVIVKKRGSPIDPDAFRKRLKTTLGGPTLTVFLTQVQGKPWMVVGTSAQQ